MTGPEFAREHGNDSTDWQTADFETELNLAEIDAYLRGHLQPAPTAPAA